MSGRPYITFHCNWGFIQDEITNSSKIKESNNKKNKVEILMLEIWNSSYVIEKIINISNLKFKLVVVVKMPVLQHSSMAF